MREPERRCQPRQSWLPRNEVRGSLWRQASMRIRMRRAFARETTDVLGEVAMREVTPKLRPHGCSECATSLESQQQGRGGLGRLLDKHVREQEDGSGMTVGVNTTRGPPVAKRWGFSLAENPLVRTIGRAPVTVRTKLLVGFAAIAVLLVVVGVLGLLALGRSNARVARLGTLQARAASYQGLQSAAGQL